MGDADYELAKEEWDQVVLTQDQKLKEQSESSWQYIGSKEVLNVLLDHVRSAPLNFEFAALRSLSEMSLLSRIMRFIFGPVVLSESDRKRTSMFISLSQHSLDTLPDNEQMTLLGTLYFNLTDQHPDSRYGSHWSNIGFQGNDPGTDLRGVGLFGLMLLISLSEKRSLSRKLFLQSKKEDFPYCTCLLTLAKSALRLLKEGHLNTLIKCRSVEGAVESCFLCLYLELERLWFESSLSSRNVAFAGELIRKIDQNAKQIFKNKKLEKPSKNDSKSDQKITEIDVIQI